MFRLCTLTFMTTKFNEDNHVSNKNLIFKTYEKIQRSKHSNILIIEYINLWFSLLLYLQNRESHGKGNEKEKRPNLSIKES